MVYCCALTTIIDIRQPFLIEITCQTLCKGRELAAWVVTRQRCLFSHSNLGLLTWSFLLPICSCDAWRSQISIHLQARWVFGFVGDTSLLRYIIGTLCILRILTLQISCRALLLLFSRRLGLSLCVAVRSGKTRLGSLTTAIIFNKLAQRWAWIRIYNLGDLSKVSWGGLLETSLLKFFVEQLALTLVISARVAIGHRWSWRLFSF